MLAVSFPLWYAIPGTIMAIVGVCTLFWSHVKRAVRWVAIRMMNMAVEPLQERLEDVETQADGADDAIEAIRTMVSQILAEVKPNGGGSMKDAVNMLVINQRDITSKVEACDDKIVELSEQMAEHRGYHEGRDR